MPLLAALLDGADCPTLLPRVCGSCRLLVDALVAALGLLAAPLLVAVFGPVAFEEVGPPERTVSSLLPSALPADVFAMAVEALPAWLGLLPSPARRDFQGLE